jgi:STE24 endopeptidase
LEVSDTTGQDTADPLRQAQARRYGRVRRRLWAADTACGLLLLVALTAAAGTLGGAGTLLAMAVLPVVLSLPFGLTGHRLSVRNGLSRQSTAGWLRDWGKGVAIGLALGGVAAFGVLALQRWSETWWPVWAWIAGVSVSAALSVLFPVLLLPLFLRSEPLPDGPLAAALRQLVAETGIAVRELRLLHMGEKTSAANAMVAGLGPTTRIYVGDTLSADAGPDEAIAETRLVLAHELGHHVAGDPWRLLAASSLGLAAGIAGAAVAGGWLAPDGLGELTALPSLALGFSLVSAAVSPLLRWYSRRRERAADAYAVAVTGEGDRYATALERLVAQNLGELHPPRFHHLLTASHPSPGERIEAARAAGRKTGQD